MWLRQSLLKVNAVYQGKYGVAHLLTNKADSAKLTTFATLPTSRRRTPFGYHSPGSASTRARRFVHQLITTLARAGGCSKGPAPDRSPDASRRSPTALYPGRNPLPHCQLLLGQKGCQRGVLNDEPRRFVYGIRLVSLLSSSRRRPPNVSKPRRSPTCMIPSWRARRPPCTMRSTSSPMIRLLFPCPSVKRILAWPTSKP